MTIGRAWRIVRDKFLVQGIDTAALDARLLAQKAFGFDGLGLTLNENLPADAAAVDSLNALAAKRLEGEPVARLLGHKEFYGLNFTLNGATLVPRPETEMLVELGVEALKGKKNPVIADFGTGSGCIVIAVLHQNQAALGVGVDMSAQALVAAKINAEEHDVLSRLFLREGSWFDPIAASERFDVIVSNPPYIPAADILELTPEVRDHDPMLALDGGLDGLNPYAEIAMGAKQHLVPGGVLAVECGIGQALAIEHLFGAQGFEAVTSHKDLAGIARIVTAKRAKG